MFYLSQLYPETKVHRWHGRGGGGGEALLLGGPGLGRNPALPRTGCVTQASCFTSLIPMCEERICMNRKRPAQEFNTTELSVPVTPHKARHPQISRNAASHLRNYLYFLFLLFILFIYSP